MPDMDILDNPEKRMKYLVLAATRNQALKRFLDNQDNPMVKALITFITAKLERHLESVASWGIEVSDKCHRKFYLKFTDDTKVSGELREVWQVLVWDVLPPSQNT